MLRDSVLWQVMGVREESSLTGEALQPSACEGGREGRRERERKEVKEGGRERSKRGKGGWR